MTTRTLLLASVITIAGCKAAPDLKTVDYVDLERFMGDWYVIASIPTPFEKRAVNGIETYEQSPNGFIQTTFTFRKDTPEGKIKSMHPKGFIYNHETNAEWRMQFFWPLKFKYLVIGLAEDYSYTVIGVPSRKYVWIMARDDRLPDLTYNAILEDLDQMGYDISRIQKMPQIWN